MYLRPYLTETNGTAEPGTIVVGRTPFHRSACTSVTRFGLVPSALARASDGGGLGLAGYPDIRRAGFAVQSGGIGVRLRLGTNGVRFRGRLGNGDLRLHLFTFGILLELLHLDLGQHALFNRMQIA